MNAPHEIDAADHSPVSRFELKMLFVATFVLALIAGVAAGVAVSRALGAPGAVGSGIAVLIAMSVYYPAARVAWRLRGREVPPVQYFSRSFAAAVLFAVLTLALDLI